MKGSDREAMEPPDGGYGWIIIGATMLINGCLLTLLQTFGIIFNDEFKAMGMTKSQTSSLLHFNNSIFCSSGLLSGLLLRKFSCRTVAYIGTSLMCTAIFLTSFANSYGYLIFTVSVLLGLGQGILMPATYVATNSYFKKRLTLAVSLSITGAGITSIFMPYLSYSLLKQFGVKGTLLSLSTISLGALVGCSALKPFDPYTHGHDASLDALKENRTDCEENNKNESQTHDITLPVRERNPRLISKIVEMFSLELLQKKDLLFVLLGLALTFASELNLVVTIQFILPDLANFSKGDVALAQSIQCAADIAGRLCIPLVAHMQKVSPKVMYSVALIISTFGRTILAEFYTLRNLVFVSTVFIGLGKGTKAVYQSVIIPKYVTLDKLAPATGLNMAMTGLATVIVGPVIGMISDRGGSYVYALHSASTLSMICIIMWILETLSRRKTKKMNVPI